MGVIEKASTTESYEQLRALLGQFLFKGDEVNKQIRNLSGGEKARVALCRMMLTPANLLVNQELSDSHTTLECVFLCFISLPLVCQCCATAWAGKVASH